MRGPLQATVPDAFSTMVMPVPSMPRALADPIFQDLDHDSRELIMYYDHNICSRIMMVSTWNPYRDLIPLVHESKAIENAILAVAACHAETSDRFDVLGSTFVQRGFLSSPLAARLATSRGDDLSSLAALGCPKWILVAVETVTSQWRAWTDHEPATAGFPYQSPAELVSTTLEHITSFDIEEWTNQVMDLSCTQIPISREDIVRLSLIWKLSAAIYTSYVLYQLSGHAVSTTALVEQLIAALKDLESDSHMIRFLLWPLFIAGAGCALPQHREWVLTTLDKIWHSNLFTNAKTAARVLTILWTNVDRAEHRCGSSTRRISILQ
ncbi:hypothetical protein G7054_g9306 [Neopestalotiopsis clavispora]|nr:hypothetical protein G7054_g9306 [Neopestalotiopsis clavispora]